MNNVTQRRHLKRTAALAVGAFASLLAVATGGLTAQADGLQAEERTYAITIDATAIVSQSWWHVPGVTPSIWTSDPETSDAYRTTEPRLLQLQPGRYKFISFTFDFPFEVTPAGMVEYAPSLNQCVEGRGTSTLIVRCKRTYPYGGTPEYSLTP
ncbi:hypothetical protein [Nitrospira lenta]|uniref:Uncharacterized protein n=1 Tax=Nitrospira lenta TaxID=1436998 RepID=A0A330L4V8_9BACT|nr:hypothetical protein [Nitrospira lenta]SPP64335.1 exported hypothetical protein [Nitrospira lenta]